MLKLRFCNIINILEGIFGDDMAYNIQFQSQTEVCLFPQQMQDGFDVWVWQTKKKFFGENDRHTSMKCLLRGLLPKALYNLFARLQ